MPFTTPAVLEVLPTAGLWRVREALVFMARDGSVIAVPSGFMSDLASIPRAVWPILRKDGTHRRAAILHDYLYSIRTVPRKLADSLFLEAMLSDGVPMWQAYAMWCAVRMAGFLFYKA